MPIAAFTQIVAAVVSERRWPAFLALEVSARPPAAKAGDLAERYVLRSYDALHLASFAERHARDGRPLLHRAPDRNT
jgi:predicted nucleic acid-binding protein